MALWINAGNMKEHGQPGLSGYFL